MDEHANGEAMIPTDEELEKRAVEAITEAMIKAFMRYTHFFGVDPHGTPKQIKALFEFGVRKSIVSALRTTRDEAVREAERLKDALWLADDWFNEVLFEDDAFGLKKEQFKKMLVVGSAVNKALLEKAVRHGG